MHHNFHGRSDVCQTKIQPKSNQTEIRYVDKTLSRQYCCIATIFRTSKNIQVQRTKKFKFKLISTNQWNVDVSESMLELYNVQFSVI